VDKGGVKTGTEKPPKKLAHFMIPGGLRVGAGMPAFKFRVEAQRQVGFCGREPFQNLNVVAYTCVRGLDAIVRVF
jgi:hypothetical protein